MLEKTLDRLADQILRLDEASLTTLYDKYKEGMDQFEPTRDWEKSVIIFFIINAVRVKNQLFNERIMKRHGRHAPEKKESKSKPNLKLIK